MTKATKGAVLTNQQKMKAFYDIFHFGMPIDGLISAISGKVSVDIIKLDKMIPNYNSDKCTYKGKPDYSVSMAIAEEYGEHANELVKSLL